MKIHYVKRLAIVIAMLAGSSAFGQDYYKLSDTEVEAVSFLDGDVADCGKGCVDDCDKRGCGYGILDGLGNRFGGGAYVDLEALFFRADAQRFVQAGRFGNFLSSTPEFENELAPRISVGYVGAGGLGIRFRYFDFAHDTGGVMNPGDMSLLIDTYNLDVELFEEVEIGWAINLEWSAGVRYNDYKGRALDVVRDTNVKGTEHQFSGWGLIFGLQANRCFGPGNFYGRARWAILQDENAANTRFAGDPANPDSFFATPIILDDLRMQTEIAIGYEVSRCTSLGIVTARVGYEMQYWEGYGQNKQDADRSGVGLRLPRRRLRSRASTVWFWVSSWLASR